ncbi:MAG: hypothetical protein IBX50_05815 [Marinospirillum sp.]|nr:hypothetical protein [Marinospirillum sp.]
MKHAQLEGEARGEVKGLATALITQIQLKFGECPEWVEQELYTADNPRLQNLIVKILTANTLESLLAD